MPVYSGVPAGGAGDAHMTEQKSSNLLCRSTDPARRRSYRAEISRAFQQINLSQTLSSQPIERIFRLV
jgi:hypothetical protein